MGVTGSADAMPASGSGPMSDLAIQQVVLR